MVKHLSFLSFFVNILFCLLLAACAAPAPTTVPAPSHTPSPSPAPPTPTFLPPSPTSTLALTQASSPGQLTPVPSQVPAATAAAIQPATPTTTPAQPTPNPSTATSTATPETPATADQGCEEKPAYYGDVTIPDETFFEQGVPFTKTWRFRNDGTCTWTTDYKLVFYSGDIMSGPLNQPFPVTVPPGEQVELSVDLVAPSRGGTHIGHWWFENPAGQRFGTGSALADSFWVKISVRFLDQNDQPQGDPASQPPPTPPAGCAAQRDPAVDAQVLASINQNRATNGLAPLVSNSALSQAAFVHSRDMACNRFVDHNGSDGSLWYDRISAQGYVYSNANENIYVGFPDFGGTAEGAVDWWMNSQVHRDNILNSLNSEIGVGYVFDPGSEWGGYYTVVFARP